MDTTVTLSPIRAALGKGTTTVQQMAAMFMAGAGGPVPNAILSAAVDLFPKYQINTANRAAELIAETAHETGGYKAFVENLNYKAAALVAQWPSHFTQAQANAAVGNPIEIGSRAYGGRMGNAPYPSHDGYVYRGRGMLALTGKSAYAEYGPYIGKDLVGNPDLASDPAISLQIACEFFKRRNVLAACDAADFVKARKLTNGGTIGIDDVAARRAKVLAVIG